VVVTVDEAALTEAARPDGCHALRTDLPKTVVAKEIAHDRYKDLAQVENAASLASRTSAASPPATMSSPETPFPPCASSLRWRTGCDE
jgi:hypothetical protein